MKGFFQGFGIIVALIIAWGIIMAISPQGGMIAGAALLIVPIIALFRTLPSIGLQRRRFSATVAFFVGIPVALASIGMSADDTRLAELRTSDPAAYLAELRTQNESEWLAELAVLDPAQHEAELALMDEARADEERLRAEERIAREAEALAAAEAREAEAAVLRATENEAKVTSYLEQLDREIASLPQINVADYIDSVDRINTAIILIGAWTLLYEEGADLPLDAAAQQKRQRFRELIIRKQTEMLPRLRDAYGPAMRRQLWEADGSARTFGPGYRTVEFVNVAFARNANIRDIHNEMRENLLILRFTRAQYKWFREASEYSYYTLEPPLDTELVMWESGARFRVVP